MNYIENVFICLAAPVLIAVLCFGGRERRNLLFLLTGMTACLLSSYISSFLAAVQGAELLTASLEIAPLVEECMKLFPLLFWLLIFEPERKHMSGCVLMLALGFATFENVCFLTQNGATSFLHLLIRGFGTGAMHVVCGSILTMGMLLFWDRLWLRVAGTAGLLAVAATYHGVYNILVSQAGPAAWIGYFMPIATAVLLIASSAKNFFAR